MRQTAKHNSQNTQNEIREQINFLGYQINTILQQMNQVPIHTKTVDQTNHIQEETRRKTTQNPKENIMRHNQTSTRKTSVLKSASFPAILYDLDL